MSQLEIFVPETWTLATGDLGASFAWQLRDGAGRVTRAGEGGLASLAPAQHCRIVLPAGRVTLARVRPPTQNRKKFMQALAFAVEDHIMADPETVHVAAGPMLDSGDMPVAIVERTWLRSLVDTLRDVGIKPERAEVETLLAPWQEPAWTLVWRTQGGFLRQGAYAGMALDGGGRQTPPPGLDLALAEVGEKPTSIRVYGDETSQPDVAQWSSVLKVPVEFVGPWSSVPLLSGQGINLLQGEFAPAGAAREWLPRLRPALVLCGVMIAVQVAFSVIDWALLRHEKKTLSASMEQNFRAAFPDAKTIVDAPLQMSRNLAGLRHAAGQADRDDFLPLLAEVAPLLGQDGRTRHLEYRQGSLKLDLTLPDNAAADALRTRLQASPRARLQIEKSGTSGLDAHVTIGGQP